MLELNRFIHTLKLCFLSTSILVMVACSQDVSEQQLLDNAKTYLDKNELKAAAIELRNVLQKNKNNAEARFLLGNISLKVGDSTTAEKEYKRAEAAQWDKQQIQLALARTFIAKQQYQKLLDEVVSQDTWSEDTRANITALQALAKARLDKITPAKTSLKDARALKSDAFNVIKTTAMFQLAGIQDGDAAQTLNKALAAFPDNTELLLLLASYDVRNKNHSAAADTYRKVISTKPPNLMTTDVHKAHIELSRLQIIENKFDEAIVILAPLLKRDKNDPEANYLSGFIHYSQSDYERAENYVRKLLSTIPDHLQSQQLMGKIKYALKDYAQAAHHLSKYLKAVPENMANRILLTQTYINLKQTDSALETLQPALAQYPDDATLQSLLSQIAFSKGDIHAGISALKKAVASRPDDIALHRQLIKAYITSGKTDSALKQIQIFQTLSNEIQESQKFKISAYLGAGKIDRAIDIAKAMLKAEPDNPDTTALNGSLYAANNETRSARNYFNKALKLQSDLPSATIGLARLEQKEGNLDKAIKLYKNLDATGQGGTYAMLALSELASQQKRTNDMLSWLEKARSTDPTDLKSRNILANYYLRNSQPNNAERYIQEALKISPEHPELIILHGKVLIAQKRYSEALSPLKRLVKKRPDALIPHLLLGEAFLHLDTINKAREHLQRVLKIQKDHPVAMLLLTEIELKAGNYDASLSYARKLQRTQPKIYSGYMQEGSVWMAQQNYKKARIAYSKAWQRQHTADLASKLFTASKHVVKHEEAIKPLLLWLNEHPESYPIRLLLASSYMTVKQNNNAIREYEKILEQTADSATALNNLAWLYSLKGDPKALQTAEKAYRAAPEHAGIQDTYGWILTQQGQAEKGLRLIRQAMQVLPDNPDIRFHFASALIKSGDNIQGKQVLKELLNESKAFYSREQAKRLLKNTS